MKKINKLSLITLMLSFAFPYLGLSDELYQGVAKVHIFKSRFLPPIYFGSATIELLLAPSDNLTDMNACIFKIQGGNEYPCKGRGWVEGNQKSFRASLSSSVFMQLLMDLNPLAPADIKGFSFSRQKGIEEIQDGIPYYVIAHSWSRLNPYGNDRLWEYQDPFQAKFSLNQTQYFIDIISPVSYLPRSQALK